MNHGYLQARDRFVWGEISKKNLTTAPMGVLFIRKEKDKGERRLGYEHLEFSWKVVLAKVVEEEVLVGIIAIIRIPVRTATSFTHTIFGSGDTGSSRASVHRIHFSERSIVGDGRWKRTGR